MYIRLATAADLPAIMVLEQSVPTAAHWSLEQYHTALFVPDRFVLLVEENSEILGFLIARSVNQEWELENIVVAASTQRRGLGAQLLDEFLKLARARHAQSIFLEVRESNLPARRFYEKHGFAEFGRRRNYYPAPQEDAIVCRFLLE